jgi:formate dehydrogenase accessory protein FdhD
MTKFALSPSEIIKVSNSDVKHVNDMLSVEEPLEIILVHFVNDQWEEKNIAVTMRTPGNDIELTTGFLFTEGIIQSFDQIKNIEESVAVEAFNGLISNQIKFELNENVQFDLSKLERNFYTTSSCGVCGKASIDAVKIACPIIVPLEKWKIEKKVLLTLNDSLLNAQENFNFSGGIHASALFNLNGELIDILKKWVSVGKKIYFKHFTFGYTKYLQKVIGSDNIIAPNNELIFLTAFENCRMMLSYENKVHDSNNKTILVVTHDELLNDHYFNKVYQIKKEKLELTYVKK